MSPYCYFLVVALLFIKTDGQFLHTNSLLRFSSEDMHDAEYILSFFFNKGKFLEYNSTLGTYTGYTAFGVKNAKRWNSMPEVQANLHANFEIYKSNGQIYYKSVYGKTVEPSVRLRSVTPQSGSKHNAMLMCTAHRFYPKRIQVTWRKNGQEVTSDVTSTEELANGNWYYQIHSYLEYTPTPGEQISCMVEHASLSHPKVLIWDPSMPESERNKIAIGASGLVLGLILTAAGFLYYKKKSRGVL